MPAALRFPTSRPDRAEPQQLVGTPPTPAVPIVRLWPFALEEVTPGDRHATSPILYGPAVIDYFYQHSDDDNTNPRPTITISYAAAMVASGVITAGQTNLLGTLIFTDGVINTETANVYQGGINHLPKWHGAAGVIPRIYPLRFPVLLDQFQVMVRFGTQTAGSHVLMGHLRILERVPPELMPNFL